MADIYSYSLHSFFVLQGIIGLGVFLPLNLAFFAMSFVWPRMEKVSSYFEFFLLQTFRFLFFSVVVVWFYGLGKAGYIFQGSEGFWSLMAWPICFVFIEIVVLLLPRGEKISVKKYK